MLNTSSIQATGDPLYCVVMTFFSKVEHSFQVISEGEDIATESFLQAAREILPFLDTLGKVAFSPVKSDINGNITKLQKKFDSGPDRFQTLKHIVNSELTEGSTKAKNSATDALLWLKRALEFIYVFLDTFVSGEQDLAVCARKAYGTTLKRYHGWMVQGIFSLAVRAVPYRKDFVESLKKDPSVTEEQVVEDTKASITKMKTNIDEINRFYAENGLDSDTVV